MRVLVTGASSDIGLEVCKRYLAEGYDVIAHYRTMRTELQDVLTDNQPHFHLTKCDFSDVSVFEGWLKNNHESLTNCDVFVHCASALLPRPYFDVSAGDLLYHFTVNTVSGEILLRELGAKMAERGWGRIVMLGSIGTKYGGGKESFPYSLSKHALEFLPGIWREWAPQNVLLNTLKIGVTDTRIHGSQRRKHMDDRVGLIPMRRMSSPREIADAVLFFGSEQNTYITGQIISVSGGE